MCVCWYAWPCSCSTGESWQLIMLSCAYPQMCDPSSSKAQQLNMMTDSLFHHSALTATLLVPPSSVAAAASNSSSSSKGLLSSASSSSSSASSAASSAASGGEPVVDCGSYAAIAYFTSFVFLSSFLVSHRPFLPSPLPLHRPHDNLLPNMSEMSPGTERLLLTLQTQSRGKLFTQSCQKRTEFTQLGKFLTDHLVKIRSSFLITRDSPKDTQIA